MRLYTAVEASKRLNKTRQTVLRWVKEKRMKPFSYAQETPLFTEEEMVRVERQLKRRKTPDTIEEEELILT